MTYQLITRAASICILAGAMLLTGCASSVTRPNSTTNTPRVAAISAQRPAGNVIVELSTQAKESDSDNKFDTKALKDRISTALERNNLLVQSKDPLSAVSVKITSLRLRGTFVAIFFGVLAGPDMVDAEVTVTGQDGKELDKFSISAAYGLGGVGGGPDSTRLGWMYEKLTERLLEEFKGSAKTAAN